MIPDKNEKLLTFDRESEVYVKFNDDFKFLHIYKAIPTLPNYVYVWHTHYSYSKVLKFHRLAKCTFVEEFRTTV